MWGMPISELQSRVPGSDDGLSNVGAATNLMANDTETIFNMGLFLHYLWFAKTQIRHHAMRAHVRMHTGAHTSLPESKCESKLTWAFAIPSLSQVRAVVLRGAAGADGVRGGVCATCESGRAAFVRPDNMPPVDVVMTSFLMPIC